MELRRGTFRVLLDGGDIGSIDMHDTIEVPIESGPSHPTSQGWSLHQRPTLL